MISRISRPTAKGKRSFLRIGLPFVVGCLLVGCATAGAFKRNMNTWLGVDVNQLMTQWGPPSGQFTMPNANTQYSWLYTGGTLVTVNYNEYLNQITAGSITYWCHITVTATPASTITAWSARGNACRSRK